MAFRRNPEPGRQAVLWLATAIILLIGAAGCTFIILAAAEQQSTSFLVLAVLLSGLAFGLSSLSGKNDKGSMGRWRLWLLSRRRTDPKTVLRIGRKPPAAVEYGTQGPPTLDSVREAAELNVTWVPHGPAPSRPRSQ